MNKKIKVIELLSEISKGKNPTFRKHGGTYRNSVWTFIISYFDKKMTHEEIVDLLNSEVEILDDEEEIDIKMCEPEWFEQHRLEMNEVECDLAMKINEIINYLLKLDKKINKENKNA